MDGITTGLTSYAYYMSAGTFGTPTLTLIPAIKDLKFTNSLKSIPATSRDDTHDRVLPGRFTKSATFSILRNKTATVQAALKGFFVAKTKTVFAFADAPAATSLTKYTKVDCYITNWSENEPEEGVATVDVEVMLAADSANAPTEVTV